jgi:hypothetical protein
VEHSSLPRFPTPGVVPPPADPPRVAASRRQRGLTDLGLLVAAAAFVGGVWWAVTTTERARWQEAEARQAEQRAGVEARETALLELARDPAWVYERLAEQYDYDALGLWCPLTPIPASPAEVARLEAAAGAADPREALCSPVGKPYIEPGSWGAHPPVGARWYRLQHPAVPDRWVGIAVLQLHFTGRSPRWVYCRVPVGFVPPPAEPAAAPPPAG